MSRRTTTVIRTLVVALVAALVVPLLLIVIPRAASADDRVVDADAPRSEGYRLLLHPANDEATAILVDGVQLTSEHSLSLLRDVSEEGVFSAAFTVTVPDAMRFAIREDGGDVDLLAREENVVVDSVSTEDGLTSSHVRVMVAEDRIAGDRVDLDLDLLPVDAGEEHALSGDVDGPDVSEELFDDGVVVEADVPTTPTARRRRALADESSLPPVDPGRTEVTIRDTWFLNDDELPAGQLPAQVGATVTLEDRPIRFNMPTAVATSGTTLTLESDPTADPRFAGCRLETNGITVRNDNGRRITPTSTASGAGSLFSAELPVASDTRPQGSVSGAQGYFNGYAYSETEKNATDVELIGVFLSSDPARHLPAEVTALLPRITLTGAYGTLVTPPAVAKTVVPDTNTGGHWTFEGWDVASLEARLDKLKVTGVWTHRDGEGPSAHPSTRWSVPSVVGLRSTDLPELPTLDPASTDAPLTPAVGAEKVTDVGILRFAGWTRESGGMWTGTWELLGQVTVSYDYELSGTARPAEGTDLDRLLRASLPEGETVNAGALVVPAAMRNHVVNTHPTLISGSPVTTSTSSLVFTGWDATSQRADGDVTFRATFEFRENQHLRGTVAYTSSGPTIHGRPVLMPSRFENIWKREFAAAAASVDPGGVWSAPNWSGRRFRDDVSGGVWEFVSFSPRSQKYSTFPTGVGSGKNFNIQIPRGSTSIYNNSLYVRADWRFIPDPIFTLEHRFDCTTQITIESNVETLNADSFVPMPEEVRSDSSFRIALYKPEDLDKPKAVPLDSWPKKLVAPTQGLYPQLLNSYERLLMGFRDANSDSDSQHYSPREWECDSGALTRSADLDARRRALIGFGLGQHVSCRVTIATSQVTLFGWAKGGGAFSSATVRATPIHDPATTAQPTTIVSAEGATSAVRDNTGLARPDWRYTLTADGVEGGMLLQGFERYTGANPMDPAINESTDWEPLGVENVSVMPAFNVHEVYRAVYEPLPTPELPLTGGTGRDLFLLLGGAGLALGAFAALALTRRRRRMA